MKTLQELYGSADVLSQVEVYCPMDEFENAIRKIGVVAACEWFGYLSDSDFTRDTIQHLRKKVKK